MYIGSTGIRGLHHLVWEIVDNSVDEALAGHATSVDVTIHKDNSVTVKDDGRGIPVATMEKEGKSALEVVLTVLHAGGKFGDGGGYKVSGGLHGVGSSVVNALSTTLDATVCRDGFVHRQSYERGVPTGPIVQGEATTETGTTINFAPDPDIFEDTVFDWNILETRLRETSFLTKGLKITLTDERGEGKQAIFHAEGGIADFVAHLNSAKETMGKKIVYFEGESEEGSVEIAMQWNTTYQESVHSFANNINTHEGGSHLSGFRSALTRTLNRYAREKGLLKEKDDNLSGEDIREGLTAVISAKLGNPQFEGQTKTKLGNPAWRASSQTSSTRSSPSSSRRTRRMPAPSSARPSAPVRPAPPPVRPATSPAARAPSRTPPSPASSPTAPSRTPPSPSCSSWRATPPAAPPSRAATAPPRPSSRSAARS